jgi:hypothetical protein
MALYPKCDLHCKWVSDKSRGNSLPFGSNLEMRSIILVVDQNYDHLGQQH